MGKIQRFSACRGEECFMAPHNTSHRGGFSFTPAPPLPHRRDTTHPARLHQRPGGTKLAQHAQNTPKSAFFRQQGEFCTGRVTVRLEPGEFCPAHAVRRCLSGEFYAGSGTARSLVGECCVVSAPPVSPVACLPPPTGTAARPSGALHTCGAWSLISGLPRQLVVRPDPATASLISHVIHQRLVQIFNLNHRNYNVSGLFRVECG